jgi:peptidoglycan/LPS O-acetylase OafA/YrhL
MKKSQTVLNFDYLRLFLATTVMAVHLELMPNNLPLWNSELAVLCFFCISGYLITRSVLSDGEVKSYALKRVARIYPPILVLAVALALFFLVSRQPPSFFYGALALPLFQDWLAVYGTGQPIYAHGAFWTLVVEAQFYVVLPLAIAFWRVKPIVAVGLFVATMIAAHYLLRFIPPEVAALAWRDNVFTLAHFFIGGMLFALYGDRLLKRPLVFWLSCVPASVGLFLFLQIRGNQYLTHLMPFALTALILAIATVSGKLGKKAPWGDLSYGIYLYHFPALTVAQIVDARFGTDTPSWTVTAATIAAAFVSWHLIEQPSIRWAHRYQARERLPVTDVTREAPAN